MTTRLSKSRAGRSGFTLVELLVAITVIAILVGMLSAAVIPVLARAREATIQMEMKQIEQQIEQFKIKNGFYPPSFAGISGPAELQRYVNLMAPNNREGTDSGHGSETRLEHWWEEIGQYLDQESSLVFWLSGTCTNKQYPITGGWTGLSPDLFAAHAFGSDGVERDVYFEFKRSQLFGDVDANGIVEDDVTTDGVLLPVAVRGFVVEYAQAHGKSSGDLLYKYRDAGSYGAGGGAYVDAGGTPINPNSFQLITFGMDGESGPSGGAIAAGYSVKGGDNLCNFADGRLEKWAFDNE